jgi:hypothetical protein
MNPETRPLIVKFREENEAKKKASNKKSKPVCINPADLKKLKCRLKSKLRSNGLTLIKFHEKYLPDLDVSIASFSGMMNAGGTKLTPEVAKKIGAYLKSRDRIIKSLISDNDLVDLKYKLWRKLKVESADHIYFHKKYLSGVDITYEKFMSMMRPYGVAITPQVKNIVESYTNGPDPGY